MIMTITVASLAGENMQLHTHQHYRILGFAASESRSFQQKLLSLGMLPGSTFYVKRVAPLGDPVEIEACNTQLVLRKKDLNLLKLEALNKGSDEHEESHRRFNR